MKINQYLDATYLKTASQANISEDENQQKVIDLVHESILYAYKLIMIRSEYIPIVKKILLQNSSGTLIGTVINFPEGTAFLEDKLKEAKEAILLGADELDFVVNYSAFKNGDTDKVRKEIFECIKLCLGHQKGVKFIIEVAALTESEIISISQLIKEVVLTNFDRDIAKKVFVKSSTGFYKTENGVPNGATLEVMKLISENAKPLKIKAAGGVRDYGTALKMISLGVDRIGTSSAKEICEKQGTNTSEY